MKAENKVSKEKLDKKLKEFTVCDQTFSLPLGNYTAAYIKQLAKIDDCDTLVLVHGGKKEFLDDNDSVHINGNEIFKKSPGCGRVS